MKKAALIGWPLRHTKSPLIHGHWLEACGIDGGYETIPVDPLNLRGQIDRMIAGGYAGFNVTIPHKEAMLDIVDYLRPEAEKIGAVNTVVINPDGSLEGRNTDAFGFIENLKETVPGFRFDGPAVVLGAGGAARAIVFALQNENMKDVRIINRTRARAGELARSFPGASAHGWDALPDLLPGAALVVNATSLGMEGQPPLEADLTGASKNAVICDIVYTPLETPLLQNAHALGLKTVTGIGMLLHQARPAFQAWFGILPDVDDALRQKVLA